MRFDFQRHKHHQLKTVFNYLAHGTYKNEIMFAQEAIRIKQSEFILLEKWIEQINWYHHHHTQTTKRCLWKKRNCCKLSYQGNLDIPPEMQWILWRSSSFECHDVFIWIGFVFFNTLLVFLFNSVHFTRLICFYFICFLSFKRKFWTQWIAKIKSLTTVKTPKPNDSISRK